jgi:hypothetical protein
MKPVYTMLYACLECRKVFKKPRYELSQGGTWETIEYERICPQCGHNLYETGMSFKAPKQTDMKQWSKIAALLRAGYRFKPDLGNPFEESPPQKKAHPEKLPSSEFRKPSRKRNKNAQQAGSYDGG